MSTMCLVQCVTYVSGRSVLVFLYRESKYTPQAEDEWQGWLSRI